MGIGCAGADPMGRRDDVFKFVTGDRGCFGMVPGGFISVFQWSVVDYLLFP